MALISKEKALEIIAALGGCDATTEEDKGFDKAIDAAYKAVEDMEEDSGWITVSERLPEETEETLLVRDPETLAKIGAEKHTVSDLVLVTVKNIDSGKTFVGDDCTVDGEWANFPSGCYEVLAWMPLPERYKPGE